MGKLLLLLWLTLCLSACGSAPTTSGKEGAPGRVELEAGEEHLAKLASPLLRAWRLIRAGVSDEAIAESLPRLQISGGRARVEVRLERMSGEILATMEEAGFATRDHSLEFALAYGEIDLANLENLALLAEVSTIAPAPRAGSRPE